VASGGNALTSALSGSSIATMTNQKIMGKISDSQPDLID
jgi:hypothetical protein